MSIDVESRTAAAWHTTPLGQYLLAREHAYFDHAVADVFGYNAFQLGMVDQDLLRASRIPLRVRIDTTGAVGLRADFGELPLATNSADLVVLPHTLEFSDNPHQILREVARVLLPEAHVVIASFNPWSLWGFRRILDRRNDYPWRGRFINLPRLKDWLALLGFDIVGGHMGCYAPPCTQQKWLDRFGFMDQAGDRWWPMGGGVYFLQAVKRVHGMRLIMPAWKDALVAKKNLAAIPKKVSEPQEPAAARERLADGGANNVVSLAGRIRARASGVRARGLRTPLRTQ
ncbi:MAG TPA: methyltransferase domain-containing protein [Burkholderiales bacterium]|nr:methyltransferase domain-containing protein [Burkholderiales bacterium]